MDKATARAINEVSKKVNDVQRRMDDFFSALHKANKADIDFLAMMGEVELDTDPVDNMVEGEIAAEQ